jgi:hypothetical protein
MSLSYSLAAVIAAQQQRGTKPLKYTSGGHDSRLANSTRYNELLQNPPLIQKVTSYQSPILNAPGPITTLYEPTYPLNVSTNSPSPITYTSSDNSVLTISGDIIHINKLGYAVITVSLSEYVSGRPFGNYYALTKTIPVTILPNNNYLFLLNKFVTFSLSPFIIAATSSITTPITYSSADNFIATITRNNRVITFDEGQVTLTASQKGEGFYTDDSVQAELIIAPVDGVNIFRYDFNYDGVQTEINLNYTIQSKNIVINKTDQSVLFTTKQNFAVSDDVQVKLICYTGELVIEQF